MNENNRIALLVIWGAFLAATVIYVVVGWLMCRDLTAQPLPLAVVAGLSAMAVGTIALGYILPPRQLAKLSGDDLTEASVLPAYQTAMIIRWACFEAVAIYGLVLTIIGCQVLPVVVGAVISAALLASARPDLAGFLAQGRYRRTR